jgi:hypothetical protein
MRALVASAVVVIAVLGACTLTTSFDGISGTRPADTGVAVDAETEAGPAVPPPRPAGNPTPGSGRTLWLGVKHFHFAHSNDSVKREGAWEDWGWDIDGLCTGALTSQQAGTCQRTPGTGAEQVRDGKACRDNNFGSQIVPQLTGYNKAFEAETNAGITDGSPVWLFVLDDLGAGADDPYVPGKLYLAARLGEKQKAVWDGTDVRTILPRSVVGGDIKVSTVNFPKGYLRNNVWVSGEPVDFETALPIGAKGELMPLSVRSGLIAFQLNGDHTTAVEGTGQVAGAIPVTSVEAFLKPFLLTQTTACPGTMSYEALMNNVRSYADVVVGAARLQDPSKSCDGVSLGLGINLGPIAPPTALGTEVVPSTGTCGGDAGVSETGVDDASDSG